MGNDQEDSGLSHRADETTALDVAASRLADGLPLRDHDTGGLSSRDAAGFRALEKAFAVFSEARNDGHRLSTTANRWGSLEIRELIGEGSFAEVYRAHDPVLERDIALKLQRQDAHLTDPKAYIDEARRLARVRHPHVLAIHGADIHDGRVGLWADLLSGHTLEEEIQTAAPMRPDEVVRLSVPLADALSEVHRCGLIHGDVKASNVFLTEKGEPVLMDFGAGSDSGEGVGTSVAQGSPLSMAPELFEAGTSTAKSDLYSLGVLIYRLLSGVYPIEAGSFEALAKVHSRRAAGSPLEIRAPRGLKKLLAALLAPVPAERPTADEAAAALRWIQGAPRRRRRAALAWAAIVGLALGLVAATVGLVQVQRSQERAVAARDEAETVNDLLQKILLSPTAINLGPSSSVADLMERAEGVVEEAVSSQPSAAARSIAVLAHSWTDLGDLERAERLARRALEIQSTVEVGEDRPSKTQLVLETRLTMVLRRAQREEEALALARRVYEREDVLPELDDLRLRIRHELALLSQLTGDLEGARQWFVEGIDLAETMAPRYDFTRRTLLGDYAGLLAANGDSHAAAQILEDLLDRQIRAEGERDGNTLTARHHLGRALIVSGRFSEAERVLSDGLRVADEWLGESSQFALALRSALATVYDIQGNPAKALPLQRQLMETLRETAERPSYNLIVVIGNLGTSLLNAGRFDEAERLLSEAVTLTTEDFGALDSSAIIYRYNLAELSYRQRDTATALARIGTVVDDSLEALGSEHLITRDAVALEALLELLSSSSEVSRDANQDATRRAPIDPMARIRETLRAHRNASGDRAAHTLQTRVLLAEALVSKEMYVEAGAELDEFESVAEDVLAPSHWLHDKAAELRSQCEGRL